ncbi:MAG: hypothetical protein AVDCRST_MAG48-1749, partial [uncultured Friedmanniella sp.]
VGGPGAGRRGQRADHRAEPGPEGQRRPHRRTARLGPVDGGREAAAAAAVRSAQPGPGRLQPARRHAGRGRRGRDRRPGRGAGGARAGRPGVAAPGLAGPDGRPGGHPAVRGGDGGGELRAGRGDPRRRPGGPARRRRGPGDRRGRLRRRHR